jgi:hypothetical protein
MHPSLSTPPRLGLCIELEAKDRSAHPVDSSPSFASTVAQLTDGCGAQVLRQQILSQQGVARMIASGQVLKRKGGKVVLGTSNVM